ncbi:MAG: hypothetical protein AAGU32_09855 [Bacillota bacterium]
MDVNFAFKLARKSLESSIELSISALVPALKDGLNGIIEDGPFKGRTVEQFMNDACLLLSDNDVEKANEKMGELMKIIGKK